MHKRVKDVDLSVMDATNCISMTKPSSSTHNAERFKMRPHKQSRRYSNRVSWEHLVDEEDPCMRESKSARVHLRHNVKYGILHHNSLPRSISTLRSEARRQVKCIVERYSCMMV